MNKPTGRQTTVWVSGPTAELIEQLQRKGKFNLSKFLRDALNEYVRVLDERELEYEDLVWQRSR